ncbi:acetylcholinesterase [Boeremia exigua]|uniref:acetylcholinesterase n=1 Tax=Boeremia exigua TaxID=749465 RepID=UPI001E8CFADB|nr:acetylcholinesterase [Boeremia exigua]KAH6616381.1 acetylcholinesterase [Boeremia exigua]
MWFKNPWVLIFAVDAVRGASYSSNTSVQLTVQTLTGSFTGFIEPEFPNTRQFRAIPFAEPPTGPRRWLPPQKLSTLPTDHRWSTKFPPSCPQYFPAKPDFWNSELTRGNLVYNGGQNDSSGLAGEATSEDCLHLAIWAPSHIPNEGLPVFFFMTGGGFSLGGVELPWQIPSSWVERSKSHIVVSINYRLNIFGFPSAQGLKDGEQNLGILDQRAALEWVRDNIAAFGGNPERIMHWGRSAGGIAADIHAYAYHDDPIAESYYFESGTIFSSDAAEGDRFAIFSSVAGNVGCGQPCGASCKDEDEQAAAELDCMRQVSQIQITNFVGQHNEAVTTDRQLRFGPLPDNKTVWSTSGYRRLSEEGKIARRPTLISFTSNEGSSLLPLPEDAASAGINQTMVDGFNIGFAACAALNSTAYRNRVNPDVPVFRFQYAAEFPNLNVYDWLGAYHNSETPLIFGAYDLMKHIANTTDYQIEISHSMQDHILAFARDPYQGPQQAFDWHPTKINDTSLGTLIRFGGSNGDVVKRVDNADVDGACLDATKQNSFPS